jgi:uncharacterized protein with HEPN domain
MSGRRRDYLLFLEDMMAAIQKIEDYTGTLSRDDFFHNSMVQDAVIRNFEIIGEAAKNVPKKIQAKYQQVEWREAAGFRDVLIHDYFGIDVESVWDTLTKNIPSLKMHLEEVLHLETGGSL